MQALRDGRDLPEARPAMVARQLDLQVCRGRALSVCVHGYSQVNDLARHDAPPAPNKITPRVWRSVLTAGLTPGPLAVNARRPHSGYGRQASLVAAVMVSSRNSQQKLSSRARFLRQRSAAPACWAAM